MPSQIMKPPRWIFASLIVGSVTVGSALDPETQCCSVDFANCAVNSEEENYDWCHQSRENCVRDCDGTVLDENSDTSTCIPRWEGCTYDESEENAE